MICFFFLAGGNYGPWEIQSDGIELESSQTCMEDTDPSILGKPSKLL